MIVFVIISLFSYVTKMSPVCHIGVGSALLYHSNCTPKASDREFDSHLDRCFMPNSEEFTCKVVNFVSNIIKHEITFKFRGKLMLLNLNTLIYL